MSKEIKVKNPSPSIGEFVGHILVLFNSGRLGFLFYLYHLILANKNWSQIEQLWSVLIRTLYIIRQKTKTRSKYVLIGHDLLRL